jgi:hypothetical protein
MTDFRAKGTIMGLAGLTAVFGMGTGGAPPVSSPESARGGGQASPSVGGSESWSHTLAHFRRDGRASSRTRPSTDPWGRRMVLMTSPVDRVVAVGLTAAADRGGQAVGC